MSEPRKSVSEELRCPFCGRDPFHYVDNGVGMEAVAVVCCDLGDMLYRGHPARPAPETVEIGWAEFTDIAKRLGESADEIDRLTAAKSGVGITDEMVGDLLETAGWFKDNGESGKHDPDDAYAKVCERAAAAITAAIGKMEGWRPIETAPKDGKQILLASLNDGTYDGFPITGYFVGGMWRTEWDNSRWAYNEFTHWMPLPSPPPTSDGGRE